MSKYIEVEVPVLGKMVVPADTNPTDLLRAAGQQLGVDVDKPLSPIRSFTRGLERGGSGTARGFAQVDGYKESTDPVAPVDPMTDAAMITPSGVTAEQQRNTDLRREFEYELSKLQGNKFSAMAGYALGTVFGDPVNLIGANASTVRAIATEAAIIGGTQGFFDPLYGQEDTMKNRAIGAAVGTVGGGALGFALGKVLKKFDLLEETPKGAAAKDEIIPNSADNVAKEINSDLAEGVPAPKVEAPTPTPAAQAVDEVTPTPAITQQDTPAVPTFLEGYDTALPPGLAKAAPRYGRNVVGFESDLDRALYIIADGAKRSAADQKYLDWVKTTTGISDEKVLRQLGAQVRDVVKATPDVGNIPRTNLALPDVQIAKPLIETNTAPFAGSVDKIGNSLNPEANVWVGLDNTSKNLYNIGRRFLEFDATGVKPRLLPLEQKQAFDFMKGIDPNLTAKEMPDVFRSYAKVLDNLAEIRGNDFKAPSMEELMRNKISHEDFADLFNRGVFDGCAL
jgi:hypothetical protein